MDILTERTPLTRNSTTLNDSTKDTGSESLLNSSKSKWITFIIVLFIGVLILFSGLNYNGNKISQKNNNTDISNKFSKLNNDKINDDNNNINDNIDNINQPHIIWFIADDLGMSDISMHGSEILTPNIDNLAKNGIELTSHYVMPLCSPSRASFLTGRHAFRMGVQATMSDLIKPQSIAHIPSSYTLASEYFKLNNYNTYAYGKWHVGYAKKSYTPLSRGFDKHMGFYQFAIDYNTKYTLDNQYGYDWFKNGNVDWDNSDESLYTTFILTDEIENDINTYISSNNNNNNNNPLFMYIAFQNPHFLVGVPDEFESNCEMIYDLDRKEYCKHVQALDYAIGKVISLLINNNLYENSIIAFSTDNGVLSLDLCGTPGGHSAAGSAYPLRGGKYTLFEGGINTPAIISGGYLDNISNNIKNTQSNTWFQAADWLPTLLHFTKYGSDIFYNQKSKNNNIDYYQPDGIDMYNKIFGITDNNNINNDIVDDDNNELEIESRFDRDGYMILNIDYKEELGGYVDTAIIYYDNNSNKIYKMIYNHELYLMGSCDIYSAKPGSYPFTSIINNDITFETNYNNMYLFELSNDKNELNDLLEGNGINSNNYNLYKILLNKMFNILDYEKSKGFMEQQDNSVQSDGDSINFNGAWEPWLDENDNEFIPKETSDNNNNKNNFLLKPLQPIDSPQHLKKQ